MQVIGAAEHGPLGLYVVQPGNGESSKSEVLLDALTFDDFAVLIYVYRPAFLVLGALCAVRTAVVRALISAQVIVSIFAVAGAAKGEFTAVRTDADIALSVVGEVTGGIGLLAHPLRLARCK